MTELIGSRGRSISANLSGWMAHFSDVMLLDFIMFRTEAISLRASSTIGGNFLLRFRNRIAIATLVVNHLTDLCQSDKTLILQEHG